MDFIFPNLPSKCTWAKNEGSKNNPHTKNPLIRSETVTPNVLHTIGNTPLVRLNKIPQSEGLKCEMLAKCEFFNPGGSVKDRIGYRMVEDAELKGLLKPGYTIIEPTSGNTGIGLALASAVKGYHIIIVMPEKMSNEKVDVLRALGAEIIRTPTEASFDSPEGLIAVSQKIQKQIPNSIILNQYTNASNPLAHYDSTCEEIYKQCEGKIDMIVMGAGTGGTITGVGRRMKELCPNCIVVGVDPEGSILAQPESLNQTDVTFYEVEGVGYDFIPTVLDRAVVDCWVKSNDKESLPMARRLIREEGLLCGASSGSALVSALKAAATLKEGQRCVVLLPDGVRNYMTKFLSDHWMEARNLIPCVNTQGHWWWDEKLAVLNLETPLTILKSDSCARTLSVMRKQGYDQLPVVDENGKLQGMATMANLMTKLVNSKVQPNDPISTILVKKFIKVAIDANLGFVSRILEKDSFVLVVEDHKLNAEKIVGIISIVDLLHYITDNQNNTASKNGNKTNQNGSSIIN